MRVDTVRLISGPAFDGSIHHIQDVGACDLANVALTVHRHKFTLENAFGLAPTAVARLRILADKILYDGFDTQIELAATGMGIDTVVYLAQRRQGSFARLTERHTRIDAQLQTALANFVTVFDVEGLLALRGYPHAEPGT
jgi:hypothetical protein